MAKNHYKIRSYKCEGEFLGVCEMLEIQNQPHYKSHQAVSFKGREDYEEYYTKPYGADCLSREEVEAERDEKLDKINEQKEQFDNLADELENSDNKIVQKAGKGMRFAASVLGLVGTFVVAKYSSKVAIETLKSAANNPAIKNTLNSLKGMEEPAKKALGSLKEIAGKITKNPKVKEGISKITESKIGKFATDALKNEKVAKVIEPLKNTLKSIKDIKINGKSIQSAVENTMAATTTGSVLVDNLTGRNNDKSMVDLATGS